MATVFFPSGSFVRVELQGGNRRMADEEDVAISVFGTFCLAAEDGRFPNLADRDSLWRLLVKMARTKPSTSIDMKTVNGAGGGRVRGESAWINRTTRMRRSLLPRLLTRRSARSDTTCYQIRGPSPGTRFDRKYTAAARASSTWRCSNPHAAM